RFPNSAPSENAERLAPVYREAHVIQDLSLAKPHGNMTERDDRTRIQMGWLLTRHMLEVRWPAERFGNPGSGSFQEFRIGGKIGHCSKFSLRDESPAVVMGAAQILG